MADQAHMAKLLRDGVNVWNQWRRSHRLIKPDLSIANLNDVDLSGTDFIRATLSGADFSNTNLTGADLTGADLTGAFLA